MKAWEQIVQCSLVPPIWARNVSESTAVPTAYRVLHHYVVGSLDSQAELIKLEVPRMPVWTWHTPYWEWPWVFWSPPLLMVLKHSNHLSIYSMPFCLSVLDLLLFLIILLLCHSFDVVGCFHSDKTWKRWLRNDFNREREKCQACKFTITLVRYFWKLRHFLRQFDCKGKCLPDIGADRFLWPWLGTWLQMGAQMLYVVIRSCPRSLQIGLHEWRRKWDERQRENFC